MVEKCNCIRSFMNNRKSGIFLHISSLPSPYGIGTFGKSAFEFVDFLSASRQSVWQVLPLVPVGMGGSPYQSISAVAIDSNYIDLDILIDKGLLYPKELQELNELGDERVDWERISPIKTSILKKAFKRVGKDKAFDEFCKDRDWLAYACYMSLKEQYNTAWYDWEEYKIFDWEKLEKYTRHNKESVRFYLWTQYEALNQWQAVKEYANSKNVQIMGDMPIYMALDSVEVWQEPKYFQLDEDFVPKAVAGVPPDYFSEDGQLWGNPLYDWNVMKEDGYKWWNHRIDKAFELYDIVRIDHFRAMDRYYSVPYGAANAKHGTWVEGVGFDLFKDKLSKNIVAEDLGLIDNGVRTLLRKTGYPGMRVMQFGFDGNVTNDNRPSNYPLTSVSYTGTHDNATLRQYITSLDEGGLACLKRGLKDECSLLGLPCRIDNVFDIMDTMIELLYASRSNIVIMPLQDWLREGEESRMNTPGVVSSKNWSYRTKAIPHNLEKQIGEITAQYNRLNKPKIYEKTKFTLGVNVEGDKTSFAVWSPTSHTARVEIFDTWNQAEPNFGFDMTKDGEIYRATYEGDLTGKYYEYKIDGVSCVDPYARAVGINCSRAMIACLADTDPVNWEYDRYSGNDCPIVWEVHIRDFSIARPIEFEVRGKFKGFVVGHKTIKGNSCLVDYLKELGVTYIQLLPVADFASVDENISSERNWGYDPAHFNALEGTYSTNPFDPLRRITEFKEVVKVLHDNNIGVIMDVVYNHTYRSSDSNLEKVAKDCYYRKFDDGRFYNGSGCGNEIATEKPMVRKFIIDSLIYWAEEYHIDGFRFDLMGLFDVETVSAIRLALDRLEKKMDKKIITYGEPWWALPPAPWVTPADIAHVSQIDRKVGIFNPTYRDGLRGNNHLSKGFLQGMAVSLSAVMSGIEGATKEREKNQVVLTSPNQNICYMSAHDNYTLYDQLSATMQGEDNIIRATKFGAFYIQSSLGVPFMLAGEEFCRTKHMNDNSYNADDSINMLDWDRRDYYGGVVDYYKGLISIRKHNKQFRDLDKAVEHFRWLDIRADWGALAYAIGDYIYIANPTFNKAVVDLTSFGKLEKLADINTAGIKKLGDASGIITVPAQDVAIYRRVDFV